MTIDVEALLAAPTPTAAAARDVLERWSSPELVNHSLRAWVWAAELGRSLGIHFDAELLYVSAMLHDLGVTPTFDSHTVAFETAGSAVGWAFAAGAGWEPARRDRVLEIIERHMWLSVDVNDDPEGHLLEVATALDVSGVAPEKWDGELLRAVATALPRGDFTTHFDGCISAQAERKPGTSAERLQLSGRVLAGGDVWDEILAAH